MSQALRSSTWLLALFAVCGLSDHALADAPADADRPRFHVELSLMPRVTVQQIEGPNRDDLLTQDNALATYLSAGVRVLDWLEPGLAVQFDVGRARRAVFGRPDQGGTAETLQLVEGSYWELWLSLQMRFRLDPFFAEVGWAPLIAREDESRTDLPNSRGETDGVFIGSRSVAWTLAVGGRIPITGALELTARLQFRIRYLVERGGEPLADGEETGQMLVWPYVGLNYGF